MRTGLEEAGKGARCQNGNGLLQEGHWKKVAQSGIDLKHLSAGRRASEMHQGWFNR